MISKNWNSNNKNTHKLTRFWLFLSVSLLLAGCKTYQPMEEAKQAMQGDATVNVEQTASAIYFKPTTPSGLGFIFYPGASINPASYAPMGLYLAQAGITIAIAKFPINLAVLAPNRADSIRADNPAIDSWALGGHSLGGVMAAQYLYQNSMDEQLIGLALLAAYPQSKNNLSGINKPVISIYASEDGLSKTNDILNTRHLLPVATDYQLIEGGNHSQFGWYGPQDGDGEAQISRQEQAHMIYSLLAGFMNN